ncbi:MAG: transcription antitermination factor NusB [Pseudomonadota bacterium]|nr:transcription antitermination factor NusB [Pseudomonadota bacterium]
MDIDRRLAFIALARILDKQRHLGDALAEAEVSLEACAEPRDRAFAYKLVATSLRRLGQIDALIDSLLDRPMPAKARGARHILRLGTAQLLFLETPAHAVVDTAVNLAGDTGQGHYKKLINAVLRRAAKEGITAIGSQDAGRLNTHDWLWQGWERAYGAETAAAIAGAHLEEPGTDLTVKWDPAGWAEKLGGLVLPNGSVRLPRSVRPVDLAGYVEGEWWVQDAAASLPARLFGDVAGKRIVDLCAAPGGKTAQLALGGALVTAVDRSEKRLQRLSENLARLGFAADIVTADARYWRPEEPVDGVLLDAPCSATGTIRRHPDIAHTRRPVDIARAAAAQAQLLAHAADLLKPGGVLVFTTCSLAPEEGPEVVANLLASNPELGHEPISAAEIGGPDEAVTAEGILRSLPCHWNALGGMDGFYGVRLVRH